MLGYKLSSALSYKALKVDKLIGYKSLHKLSHSQRVIES